MNPHTALETAKRALKHYAGHPKWSPGNRAREALAAIEAALAELDADHLTEPDRALIDRLGTDDEGNLLRVADYITALEQKVRQAEARLAKLCSVVSMLCDVPPEHESEPIPFHKGWEACARSLLAKAKEGKSDER